MIAGDLEREIEELGAGKWRPGHETWILWPGTQGLGALSLGLCKKVIKTSKF